MIHQAMQETFIVYLRPPHLQLRILKFSAWGLLLVKLCHDTGLHWTQLCGIKYPRFLCSPQNEEPADLQTQSWASSSPEEQGKIPSVKAKDKHELIIRLRLTLLTFSHMVHKLCRPTHISLIYSTFRRKHFFALTKWFLTTSWIPSNERFRCFAKYSG